MNNTYYTQVNWKLVNCQMSPVIISWPNIVKGTAKALAVDLLTLNTLRGKKKIAFLWPKKVRKVHPSFLCGSPHPLHPGILRVCNQHVLVGTRLLWLQQSIAKL